METFLEQRGEMPLFRLAGVFDLYAVGGFRMAVEPVLEATTADVALDFAEVTHIDSSGMGTIIQVMHRLRDDGRTVILTRVPPNLAKIFGYARLDQFFLIVDGEEFDERFPSL